ncbi:hypothetical protein HG530_006348 [Fusarium avenaceum]|nr:hypothetical protein HG530_006348 [Fusarium avenaceum]
MAATLSNQESKPKWIRDLGSRLRLEVNQGEQVNKCHSIQSLMLKKSLHSILEDLVLSLLTSRDVHAVDLHREVNCGVFLFKFGKESEFSETQLDLLVPHLLLLGKRKSHKRLGTMTDVLLLLHIVNPRDSCQFRLATKELSLVTVLIEVKFQDIFDSVFLKQELVSGERESLSISRETVLKLGLLVIPEPLKVLCFSGRKSRLGKAIFKCLDMVQQNNG